MSYTLWRWSGELWSRCAQSWAQSFAFVYQVLLFAATSETNHPRCPHCAGFKQSQHTITHEHCLYSCITFVPILNKITKITENTLHMHTGETLLPKIHFWWIDIHVSEIKWKTGHFLQLFHLYIFKITQQTSKINNYNNFSKLTKLSLLLSRTICFDSFLFTWEREQTSTCYKENETYRLILSLCLTDIFNLQLLSPRPWRSFLLFLFFLCALDLYRCFHWKETITHSINSLNTDDEEVLTTGNYNCAYFALIRPISIAQRTVSHSSRCSRMGSQKEQIFILCTASLFLSRGISYHRLKMSSGKKSTWRKRCKVLSDGKQKMAHYRMIIPSVRFKRGK